MVRSRHGSPGLQRFRTVRRSPMEYIPYSGRCAPRARPETREEPMTTLLYTHAACLEHDPGSYHPESPERLRAVLAALATDEFAVLERREAPLAAPDDLVRVHPRAIVDQILAAVPRSGHI